jgi:BirA family biotin operon repressor/biotin-[acetyl-CoA-carboxylase] ligase
MGSATISFSFILIPHPSVGIDRVHFWDGDHHAVIGIGLNVNVDFSQQVELREIAASLMHLAGREIDRRAVLKAVVAAFVDRYAWISDAARLREAWAARLITLRRHIRVNLDDQMMEGYAESVDDDGALLLRTTDDQLHRLLSGDVTLHNS